MSADDFRRAIHNHVAGATVQHVSPFSTLEVPARREAPSPALVEGWIKPFYMTSPSEPAFAAALVERANELDDALIRDLLSFFDWRPRIVGAYLAAIVRSNVALELIEPLFLRSDVCDAGRGYALALARINAPSAPRVLERYLDFYLTRPELWFDQSYALAALGYLDKVNGSDCAAAYTDRWKAFVANKPNWDLQRTAVHFDSLIGGLARCAAALGLEQPL